jgi:hypothetical protein
MICLAECVGASGGSIWEKMMVQGLVWGGLARHRARSLE